MTEPIPLADLIRRLAREAVAEAIGRTLRHAIRQPDWSAAERAAWASGLGKAPCGHRGAKGGRLLGPVWG